MAESTVVLPPDSTGKGLRTQTGGPNSAHQQVITLADSAGNLLGTAAAGLPVTSPDAAVTGTLTALNSAVAISVNGRGDVAFQLTGTWVGTVTFQGTVDPTGTAAATGSWVNINAPAPTITSQPGATTTTNGVFVVRVGAYTAVRVLMSAYTSGTAVVWANASVASNTAALAEPVTIGAEPDTVASGTLSATDAVVAAPAGAGALVSGASTANSYLSLLCPGGDSAWVIQLTGTFGSGTVWFEESVDSTTGVDGNWINVNGRQTGIVNTVLAGGVTTAGIYRGNTSGAKYLRVRITGATTPSVAATIRLSSGTGAIFLNASIPAGTNTIGAITGTGTAGTPATGVQTVQGITGGTAIPVSEIASSLFVSTTAAISTALTATLPAAGAGLFHYITGIEIQRYAGAALTGAAAPVVVTTTNLPGSPAWSFDTAAAIGTSQIQLLSFAGNPLKSSAANTATTIVAPTFTSAIWRINVSYYTGS